MYTKDLVKKVAEKLNCSEKEAKKFFDATRDSIKEAIADGESVHLYDFGTFYKKHRVATRGYNPVKGELVEYPASVTVKFAPVKSYKAELSK